MSGGRPVTVFGEVGAAGVRRFGRVGGRGFGWGGGWAGGALALRGRGGPGRRGGPAAAVAGCGSTGGGWGRAGSLFVVGGRRGQGYLLGWRTCGHWLLARSSLFATLRGHPCPSPSAARRWRSSRGAGSGWGARSVAGPGGWGCGGRLRWLGVRLLWVGMQGPALESASVGWRAYGRELGRFGRDRSVGDRAAAGCRGGGGWDEAAAGLLDAAAVGVVRRRVGCGPGWRGSGPRWRRRWTGAVAGGGAAAVGDAAGGPDGEWVGRRRGAAPNLAELLPQWLAAARRKGSRRRRARFPRCWTRPGPVPTCGRTRWRWPGRAGCGWRG